MEEWKLIEGFEGLYEVSSFGKVRNVKRNKILKHNLNNKNYPVVYLYVGIRKKKTIKIHRLVTEAFIPNPDNKPQVNHIDGNKQNNHISNLEWCTNSENQIHAYKIGLQQNKKGIINGNSKLTEKDVLEIREKYIPRIYTLSMLSKEYGVWKSTIEKIVNKKTWKHI